MEFKKGLISVICAIRNDERFIRETLETVVSQTYPYRELIVMDGASTDRTVEIVKEYAARHENIIWRSESDRGQWDALEKALELSKGEYLFVLCGQDGYLDKDWFKRCMETFEAHPEVSLVWGIPFNMSEDGKLLGPHYAYAGFLKKEERGLQTKPLETLAAKIDWRRPDAMERLWRFARKITWPRVRTVLGSFRKREIPQKEEWFFYWLRTGLMFPDGNMCMRKEVYVRNAPRFSKELLIDGSAILADFYFNFNANGYLAYGLPLPANFGRSHAEGQPLRSYDAMAFAKYHERVVDFRKKLKEQKNFKFVDPAGKVVSERTLPI